MRKNKIKAWLVHMLGYALVLMAVSVIFQKNIYIDTSNFAIWGIITVIIIFILNKTIKPLLVWMTLPLTALTLGLFYPLINIIIFKITDFILGKHFEIRGTIMLFFISIVVSIMNALMDNIIIKPILKGGKK